MRIKSVELKNHINFEDLHIDNLDTADIITLSGANGSGKSFFINTLHPWPTSSRYVKNYSIIEGREGYKKIIFQKNNGDLVEVMHEYMPKKNTHSCKSYINIIRNGVRQELNPTGHSEVFKEMVKKHLNFDNNVFEVSCISFKTNGITSSSSVNRKKIMETTLKLDGLKSIKKKAGEVNSTYNATARLLEQQKIKILTQHDAVTIEKDIDEYQRTVDSNEKQLRELLSSTPKLEEEYQELDSISEHDKGIALTVGKILKALGNNKTLNSEFFKYKNYKIEIPSQEKELQEISNKLKRINDFNELVAQLDQEEERVKETKKRHKLNKDECMKYFTISKDDYRNSAKLSEIITELKIAVSMIRQMAELIRSCPVVYTTDSIIDLLDKKQTNMQRITNFISKFDMYQSMTDGNEYTVPYASNCDSCTVYDKFVKSSQFVKDNSKQYKDIKMNIGEENREINTIQSIINVSNGWKIGKILSKYINEEYLELIHMDTVQSFITECSNNYKEEERINTLISKLEYMIICNSSIDDAITSMNHVKEKKELFGDMSDEKSELTNRYNEISRGLASKVSIYNALEDAGMGKVTDEMITKYGNATLYEMRETCQMMISSEMIKKNLLSSINNAYETIDECKSNISKYNSLIAERKLALDQLKDTSSTLQKITIKKQVAQRLKEIIEKDIPIMLMKNNLDYIERSVNAILQDNNINYSIHIVPSDTEIQIEATINGKYIPDVSLLSAGETCIISLLLNASILRILGYNILCLDEIDANLDTVNKRKFSSLIYSIMNVLGIDQVICVSHNITENIDSAVKLLIGEGTGLDLDTSSMIRIK